MRKIILFLTNDSELDGLWQKFLSLVFLLIAAIMVFFTYPYTTRYLGFLWEQQKILKITPDFLSALIGILIVSPLYLRKILKWNKSVYSILSFVLIVIIFSSFVNIALKISVEDNNLRSYITYFLISFSILLSWLGIRSVAGISWILLIMATIYNIINNNIAMGFNGFLYITFSILGLVMHTGLNPGDFFNEIKNEYTNQVISSSNKIKEDISATKEVVNDLAQKIK